MYLMVYVRYTPVNALMYGFSGIEVKVVACDFPDIYSYALSPWVCRP